MAESESDFASMARILRDNGYTVFETPVCDREAPHGRHVLKTRSAVCEGKEPIPHGYHSSHMGSFGIWVNCKCGHSFSDCTDPPTPWEKHQAEFIANMDGDADA